LCAAAEGQVLVDGTDLTLLDAAWYRSRLGVVSQEPRLFSLSVRDNIAYGACWAYSSYIVIACMLKAVHGSYSDAVKRLYKCSA
jgi:ABC-type multidrug transport system fused ATPase/permease subunit